MGGESRVHADSHSATKYQHVVVVGLPYDRGFAHGTQVRDKILKNLEYYRQPGKLLSWPETLLIIHQSYLPALRQYFPAALEEMRGIADGAKVQLEDIIMLNARYDLSRFKSASESTTYPTPPEAECTSAIFLSSALEDDSVITAQNWDMSAHLFLVDTIIYLEVHPHPSENIPAMFIVTEAGQLCRSGMNTAGLGLTANSLQSKADFNPLDCPETPLLPASIVRRLFLHQKKFSEAIKVIARTPVHVSSNITVSTSGNFGFCFEVTPAKVYRLTASPASSKPYLIHTNHFLHPDFTQSDTMADSYGGGSSWYRGERLEIGIKPLATTGFLTESAILNAFKDHMGYPQSLCEHIDEGKKASTSNEKNPYAGPNCTVACVVYNLSKGRVTVCKGPPCVGVFEVFHLKEGESCS